MRHYASPYVRIVGDADCFVDPFSHQAFNPRAMPVPQRRPPSALVSRAKPRSWQQPLTLKEGGSAYTRFLDVFSSVLEQNLEGEEPAIADYDRYTLNWLSSLSIRINLYTGHKLKKKKTTLAFHTLKTMRGILVV
ncbi:hypothetical protein sscle_05g043890 [Sclerotinia sclerotiorum 1980 UF-70]|uniref:Uncharacterized protein n=1 Tax=Sclerotinia sclerotiorum (strain ATCC 18683 / 1980 / Ss-1) TaxID=665079 RepID=A0A1D9Q419_SCLS1|nr:hypothetical protein sscle_05g043890 [Sclerotinia sclerotiorum 1980 UF-70]